MSCMESDVPISNSVHRSPSGLITKITFRSFPGNSLTKSNSTLDFSNFTWKDFEQVYFKPRNYRDGCITPGEVLPVRLDKSLQIRRCTKFESLTNGMTSKKIGQSTLLVPDSANLTQQKRMVEALHNYCLSPETIYPLAHMSALPNLVDPLSNNVAASTTIKNCVQSPSEDVLESENLAQQRRMVEALHNYCRCPKREEANRIATKKKLRQYAALVNKQKKKINKLKLQVQMLERSARCKE